MSRLGRIGSAIISGTQKAPKNQDLFLIVPSCPWLSYLLL
jgi:hypothetical protein